MAVVVGIDLGSTNTKVVLADVADRARVLRIGRVATPDDAPSLLRAVARLVRDCVALAPEPVAAIGIASMAETGVALDSDGRPLTPLLRWDRAQSAGSLASMERVIARHPDLPERTGIPATPKPALLALHRLREQQPEAFARMARWQGIADLVAGALTGAHATDHTLAARTMMLDSSADASGRTWRRELLDDVGIGPAVLPRILAAGESAGSTDGRASAFGLPPGIPVHIAGHDHAVGAWAAGARRPGQAADSLGTAEAVVAVTTRVDASAVADGFSIGRTVDDEHPTIMGGSPSCGALLTEWPGDAVGSLAAESLDAWITSPITVLPYPRGRQCPAPDPDARLRTLGSARAEGDLERGLLQSLVLHSRWIRTAMELHTGQPIDSVLLLGSLAERIPAWGPLVAAAGGIDVLRCVSPEPVAVGAALIAAVRAGLASPAAALAHEPTAPLSASGLDAAGRRFLDAAASPR